MAILKPSARTPTLAPPSHGGKPVEDAEIQSAAGPRTDRAKYWELGRTATGCAESGKGKKLAPSSESA